MKHQTVDQPALCVRAAVQSIDVQARTVELIFSTGAAVDRCDPWTGKRYIEVLSMDPAHVRLDRLNGGASVLDSHSAYSISNILGAVEPNSARIEKGIGILTARFSRREDVESVWQDIQDGIVRWVSVGYRVHRYEEVQPKDGTAPIRTAIDWEPYEISMVPMPADAGARTRGTDKSDTNPCVIVSRGMTVNDADRMRRFRLAQARA